MDFGLLGCCFLAFILYINTFNADFVYDDRRAILNNADIWSKSWSNLFLNDFWGTSLNDSGSHGSYRPLCVLSFRLNYLLSELKPWSYHLFNILLHCLVTGLVVQVAREIFPRTYRKQGSIYCGLLFACHPIHTEAVAGVVGRADLLATLFTLLSLMMYIKHVQYRDNYRSIATKSSSKHCFGNFYKVVTDCDYWYLAKTNYFLFAIFSLLSVLVSTISLPKKRQQSSKWRKSPFKHIFYVNQWSYLCLCIIFAMFAVLCKEIGISALMLCIIYDLTHSLFHLRNQKQSRSLLLTSIGLITILCCRCLLISNQTPTFSKADNPTSHNPSIISRFLMFTYLPVLNFYQIINPVNLSFDWSMNSIPQTNSIFDYRNLFSLIFYSSLWSCGKHSFSHLIDCSRAPLRVLHKKSSCYLFIDNNNNSNKLVLCCCQLCQHIYYNVSMRNGGSKKSFDQLVMISLAFLIIPFLPASNLFFYVGFVIAERILYLPSIGYCLLLTLIVIKLQHKFASFHKLIHSLFIVLLIVFCVRTLIRNQDWRHEEALFRSAIHINPPKAYGNLGSVLNSQKRYQEAEWAYRKALQFRPNMADVHYNLAILFQQNKRYDEAIKSFENAISFRPSLALAYVNLGATLIMQGKCQEAVEILIKASKLDGTGLKDRKSHENAKISAFLQLGSLYSQQGRFQNAINAYKEALHILPDNYQPQSIYNLIGEALSRLEEFHEAEYWYQAALLAKPDHVPAHLTYGKLLAKNISRIFEAEAWFHKAVQIAPGDPSVHYHYGEFLVSLNRLSEAANHYIRAAELKPADYELVITVATVLRQANRKTEAEYWYRKAVKMKPFEARSHANLGAILHMNGKYKQAKESYQKALQLEPDDITTLQNLHKLYNIIS